MKACTGTARRTAASASPWCLRLGREIALAAGALEQAESYAHESLAIAREVGHEQTVAFTTAILGASAVRRGAFVDAERLMRLALDGYEESGDFVNAPTALETCAELAHASGDAERAAEFLGAAVERRERLGMTIVPARRAHRDHLLDDLRRALTAPAFEAAFARGRRSAIETMLATPITRS